MKWIWSFVLLCAMSGMTSAIPAIDKYEMISGVNCWGDNIVDSGIWVSTPQDCAQVCLTQAGCVAFTFDNEFGSCWPKPACDPGVMGPLASVDSYVLKPEDKQFDKFPGGDCYGNDVARVTQSDAVDCARVCLALQNCVAFVLDANAECWPKIACDVNNLASVPTSDLFMRKNPPGKRTTEGTKRKLGFQKLAEILMKSEARREYVR